MVQLWRAQQASKVWPQSCTPKPRRAAHVHYLPGAQPRSPTATSGRTHRGWEAKADTLTPGSAQVGGHGAHSTWSPPGEGALSADIAPVSWLQARVPASASPPLAPVDLEIGKVVAGLF